jgi:hypothetical protein
MEMAMHSRTRQLAAAVAILTATAPSAHADILLAKSRMAEFYIPNGSGVTVPLDAKDNSVLTFETKKKGLVKIVYNAECAATGDPSNWIGLEIYVDDKLANPKAGGDDFALCSATGGSEIYTAVSRQAWVKLDEGTHTVRVLVSKQGVATGRLDDTSIVVKD